MPESSARNQPEQFALPITSKRNFGNIVSLLDHELCVCLGITVIAASLHVVRLFCAGGLWRDEAGLVALSTLPRLSEVWEMLTHDSFPILFPVLVRTWSSLGLGSTDICLRILGLLIGLSLLAAVWWAAWVLGRRRPLISLSLLAVNATVLQWGDSLRAYGLGAVLTLITLGAFWRMVERSTIANFFVASLVSVLAVQCLYQNSFLLAAICISATVVCLRHRRFSTALLCIVAAIPAVVSLVPYLQPLRESQRWWVVEKAGFRPSVAWASITNALGTPPWIGPVIWLGLFIMGVSAGLATLEQQVLRRDKISVELPLFAGLTCLLSTFGFFLFLWEAGLPSQPWYWLPLMPLVAVCIQTALSKYTLRNTTAWAVATGVFALVSTVTSCTRVCERQTNVDIVARTLNEQVADGDLVIVYPWYYGVSFSRYYAGQAEWLSIPPVADHRFHRYDLLKEKLAATDPIGPTLNRLRQTLQSGKKVWVVASFPEPQPGEVGIPELPPAPHARWGWYDAPYNYVWGLQLRHFIQSTALQTERVRITHTARKVNQFENMELMVASGARFGALPTAAPQEWSGQKSKN